MIRTRVVGLGMVGCAVLLGIAQGCSSTDTSTPGTAKAPDQASKVVGTEGGNVATADGNAEVDIPPGALPANTTITIRSNTNAPAPGSAASVGTPYTFGPDGLVFLKPVTVTLGFDPSRLPGGKDASSIVVFTAPDGSAVYEPLPTAVKDASHVAATTIHFSTDVPGVATPPPADAGACYVTCTGGGASTAAADAGTSGGDGGGAGGGGGSPPTTSVTCDCQATCDGHTYDMACTDSSCTCTEDGAPTATISNSGQCGGPTASLGTYNNGCKFPGTLPPPPDCIVTCGYSGGAAADAGASSGTDGGVGDGGGGGGGGSVPSSVSCDCTATCHGHAYEMACANGSCTCKTDGTQTGSASDPNTCSATLDRYNNGCGFPGSYGTASGGGSDGGTSSEAGASADGGSSGGGGGGVDAGGGGGGDAGGGGGGAGDAGGGGSDAGGPVDAGPG